MPAEPAAPSRAWVSPVVVALGAVVAAVELSFGGRYPLFRDELYYLACADHLAWGYVDQPPLSIAVLWAVRGLFGDSLLAVRVLPALLGGVLVMLTGRIARVMGGGGFAEGLAALAAAVAPVYLGTNGLYSMNTFDLVFWASALLLVAQLAAGGPPRLWLLLGMVVGLGLLNKLSPVFLLAGLVVGVVATPLRRQLRRWEPWAGLGLAVLVALPHFAWQVAEGFPTLEFIANATREKNVSLPVAGFALGQVRELNPIAAPLWLAGLAWLLVAKRGAFRVLAVIYLVAFAIFALQHGKTYYLAGAYPPLFAAGAIALEGLPGAAARWSRLGAAVLLFIGGVLIAPFAVPVLPVEKLLAYQARLGIHPVAAENNELGLLPQHFADRFGWEELTGIVSRAWRSLPEPERRTALIVTNNYGQASALNYYGRREGLPRAVSQHNAYYTWGPGQDSVEVAVIVGMRAERLRDSWRECVPVETPSHPWAMPFERARPVLICRGLLLPLDEAWRRGKHFI